MPGVIGNLLETLGPVVAAPCEDLDGFVGEMDLHAVAVELDFVNPSLAGWHAVGRGGESRRDEAGQGRLDAERFRLFPLEGHG